MRLAVLGDSPTREDCKDLARPCRFVWCRHHLRLVEGSERPGRRWRGKAPPDKLLVGRLRETCTLDVVDKNPDGLTLDDIGLLMRATRERIRQLEVKALFKLERGLHLRGVCTEASERFFGRPCRFCQPDHPDVVAERERGDLQRAVASASDRPVTCSRCGERGHNARTCALPDDDGAPDEQATGQPSPVSDPTREG